MNRGLLALAALVLSAGETDAAAEEARARGVVLILADDVGTECFGSYGGESYATPHLDALAASGMQFDHAHAQPLCTPSRVKILTGLSNARNYTEFQILRRGEHTFAHALRASGHRTAITGKWQLFGVEHRKGRAGTGTRPGQAGFQDFHVWHLEQTGSRYWEPHWEERGKIVTGAPDEYGPDLNLAWAVEFLREHHERPFLLYWSMALPHPPFVPTPRCPDPDAPESDQHFGPMLEYLDHQVGQLVAALERLEIRDQTLLLFTSDNGTHRSIRSIRHGKSVQGGKGLTTDNATHVPLIASWPGVIEPGSRSDDLIDLADIFPTLCEATATAVPEGLDGRSFLPQLRGAPGQPRDHLFCYYDPRPGNEKWPERRWTRDRRYKLYGDGRFFDVVDDPLEKSPLLADGLTQVGRTARERLQRALGEWPEHGVAGRARDDDR